MHVLMILDYFVVLILFYSSFISFDFMWRLSCILLCSRFYWDSSFSIYSKFLSSCHWSLNPRINGEMGFFILVKHWVHCLFLFLLSFIPQRVFVSFPLYTWSPNMWPCSWLPPMKFLLWANTLEPEVFMNLGQSVRYVNVVLSVVNQWDKWRMGLEAKKRVRSTSELKKVLGKKKLRELQKS